MKRKEISVCKGYSVRGVETWNLVHFHKRTIFENSIVPPVTLPFRVCICSLDSKLQFLHTSTSISISHILVCHTKAEAISNTNMYLKEADERMKEKQIGSFN